MPASTTAAATHASPTGRQCLQVLVVDDMQASRAETAQRVREVGHLAIEVGSGAEAIAVVASLHVDLVLLDLLMPDMDGFQATRLLRAREPQSWLPVVVMSSMAGADHFVKAIEQGADDYLIKPISPELLRAKLRNIGRALELQARLAAQAAHNRALFDHVGDAVLTVNDGQRICDANCAGLALLGLSTLPPEGIPLPSLIPSGLPPLEVGDPRQIRVERNLRHADGSETPAEIGVSGWSTGSAARISLVVRDLSEPRRLERLKDEFLSTISHELRTPLTSVLGALGLLAGGVAGELPEHARRLTEVAQRNGERLGRLIDDVLDLTKLEADRMTLNLRVHELLPLLEEAVQANTDYARRLGRTLRVVASPPPGLQVEVDANRLLQVMANLLSNAVKHSPPDRPVEIRCHRAQGRIRIAVRDHGPGIDPAFRVRLFEKFSQAEQADRRAGAGAGTGLGLHISRLLVERMGGKISAVSTTGHGAEFVVDLPAWQGGAECTLPPPHVVVIDRDAQARARIAALLSPVCELHCVASLEQAVDEAAPAPRLLIADPEGAGGTLDTVCARLRRLAGPAPVLLYTDVIGTEQAGAYGFTLVSKRSTGNDAFVRVVRLAANLTGG
ncbi:response regulator [Ralstonia solanacearum]|uniref:hybrid sensor histidine kinase/response regulator n=1 Tax=Ralstonia solanacearum TaxID=305 RepID=UPI0005C74A2E|nr:ATP-binding protein [Ralstonia solanacearum]MDB0542235.1 response regulator [Ralstonia solanacearum]MDB0552493.1 response regulator [Ralstonia solanacearum]MDB0557199.1 response regulator [Ralstonia solanacearum]